ncbi:hypothetical protein C2S52_020473 [Perilla frutescens var. hirtella]|nr:hypothetical protein C2S52_020473 [Perilla frutescens var. hirtella]KAH6805365.1 hypothetical protein C2S51_030196 [Perilla frutescens var. frutescens]
MVEYVSRLDDGDETKFRALDNIAATGDGSSTRTFFRVALLVHRGKVTLDLVERARKCLTTEVAALVVDYCTLSVGNPVADGRRVLICNMWSEYIKGA